MSLGACGEDPMKALPKNLLEDRGKERQGVLIRLSTDMILKPWYWELESPWIHISKTLILAPLTAGLAFTLTSWQLLQQISHGNIILLTSCFPPPPLFLSRALCSLRLLTGLPCVPIRIRSGRWINTWSWFPSFSEKKKFLSSFSCSWSWRGNLKEACTHYWWAGYVGLLLIICYISIISVSKSHPWMHISCRWFLYFFSICKTNMDVYREMLCSKIATLIEKV